MSPDSLLSLFAAFGRFGPMMLLYAAAIVIAIQRWSLHPQVSALAAAGFGLHLLDSLGWAIFIYWQQHAADSTISSTFMPSYALFSAIAFITSLVGTVLLIMAVFGWRQASAATAATVR